MCQVLTGTRDPLPCVNGPAAFGEHCPALTVPGSHWTSITKFTTFLRPPQLG